MPVLSDFTIVAQTNRLVSTLTARADARYAWRFDTGGRHTGPSYIEAYVATTFDRVGSEPNAARVLLRLNEQPLAWVEPRPYRFHDTPTPPFILYPQVVVFDGAQLRGGSGDQNTLEIFIPARPFLVGVWIGPIICHFKQSV